MSNQVFLSAGAAAWICVHWHDWNQLCGKVRRFFRERWCCKVRYSFSWPQPSCSEQRLCPLVAAKITAPSLSLLYFIRLFIDVVFVISFLSQTSFSYTSSNPNLTHWGRRENTSVTCLSYSEQSVTTLDTSIQLVCDKRQPVTCDVCTCRLFKESPVPPQDGLYCIRNSGTKTSKVKSEKAAALSDFQMTLADRK